MNVKTMMAAAVVIALAGAAHAQVAVVPTANTATPGTSGLNSLTRQFDRAYMATVPGADLAAVAGQGVIGIQLRGFSSIPTNPATWPAATINWANFDIFIGEFNAPIGSVLNTTYANNFVSGTRVQVRGGGLTVAANSYTTAASGVSPWGPMIDFNLSNFVFDSTRNYVIEIRHTGNDGNTAYFNDAIPSAGNYRAIASSGTTGTNYAATTGGTTSFIIMQFVVPSPGSAALLAMGGLLAARRRRA